MTPTDAQIRAAAKSLADYHGLRTPRMFEDQARRALAAAAEVGANPLIELHSADLAAEVGEPNRFEEMYRISNTENDELRKEVYEIKHATIERCAKFAENYFETEYEKGYGEMIADAMRIELKDKP